MNSNLFRRHRFLPDHPISSTLEMAELKGGLKKKINSLAKFDLIAFDEHGYLPMSKQATTIYSS